MARYRGRRQVKAIAIGRAESELIRKNDVIGSMKGGKKRIAINKNWIYWSGSLLIFDLNFWNFLDGEVSETPDLQPLPDWHQMARGISLCG